MARTAGREGSGRPEPLSDEEASPPSSRPSRGGGRLEPPAGRRVVVLGHRPPDIGGYESNPTADAIRQRLHDVIAAKSELHDDLVVLSGLRLGVEQLGAEAALAAGVPLVAVLPYPDPERVWPAAAQDRFRALCEAAHEVKVLQKKQPTDRADAAKALARRDSWFTRAADEAVVVWDGQDAALGSLVRKLEGTVGDDLWLIDPAECR
ncbi:MAG: SLOG family protein [Acidimicrobiia bacterium]|nr:SLOG family protein [Acidimicrobiia bacterium]